MSNEQLGIVAELGARREVAVRGLSLTARHHAFPNLYATPLPLPDPTAPLRAEIVRLKKKVGSLQGHNQRLQALLVEKLNEPVHITAAMVLDQFCEALGAMGYSVDDRPIATDDLIGTRKSIPYFKPRHVAMWLVRRLCKLMSLPKIGLAFNGRDHTTIIYGCRQAPKIMEQIPLLRGAAEIVLAKLEPGK